MAGTLRRMHHRQLCHGDVQPENIVLDANDNPVLIDGLVNLLLSEAKSDSRVGLSGYISPEQQDTGDITYASDLYSLGVVITKVLTNRLPSQTVLADGTRVDLPSFPPTHSVWEPFVRKLVDPDPDKRFASTLLLNDALNAIDLDASSSANVVKANIVTSAEIAAVVPDLAEEQDVREAAVRTEKKLARAAHIAWIIVPIFLIGGLVLGSQVPAVQGFIADLGIIEHPNLHAARQQVLALRADTNQDLQSIIAAYRNVQSYAPDEYEALEAEITEVKAEWSQAIETGLATNELVRAEQLAIQLTRQDPTDEAAAELYERVQVRKRAMATLADAEAQFRTYSSTDSARTLVSTYKEVVRLYPTSEGALSRLDTLAARFSERALTAIAQSNLNDARIMLALAESANSAHTGVLTARDQLKNEEGLQAAIKADLDLASRHRAAGSLIMPTSENAAAVYQRVLASDPQNPRASQGLLEIHGQVRVQFDELIEANRLSEIENWLEAAKAVDLAPELIDELSDKRDNLLILLAKADELVRIAEELFLKGYITAPVQENAVQQLRAALRHDPINQRAHALLAECADRLIRVAQEAYSANMSERAFEYLAHAATVQPENRKIAQLRRVWQDSIALGLSR